MCGVFAPSSTPSRKHIIDCLSVRKSYHTLIADVTDAYFHVDEDEECHVDPLAEWLEQQAALGNSTSVLWRLRNSCLVGDALEHAGQTSGRNALKSKVSTDAAPQVHANYGLDVFIEVHMDDLHGLGQGSALDLVQANL